MKRRNCLLMIVLAVGIMFLYSSCKEKEETKVKRVEVLCGEGSIGDESYTDVMLKGIKQCQNDKGFDLVIYELNEEIGANEIFSKWMAQPDDEALYILTESQFVSLLEDYKDEIGNKKILFLESDKEDLKATTFNFSGYGVSYLAGVAAYELIKSDSAAFLGGASGQTYIESAEKGFNDGFMEAGGKYVRNDYLSDNYTGFYMIDEAYQYASQIYAEYPFICPVAGASNLGIYRFLNENPGYYSCGVDIDQSYLSDGIAFSLVKRLDKLMYEYIEKWLNGEELGGYHFFDLTSGYVDLVISPNYNQLNDIVEQYRPIAIEKEHSYLY